MSDEDLFQHVVDSWPHLAACAGLDADAFDLTPVWHRIEPDGQRAVFRAHGKGRTVIAKFDTQLGARPFEARLAAHLAARARFAGVRGLGVPRILAASVPARALVMDFIRGRTAHDAVAAAGDAARRHVVLSDCAGWARHLHDGQLGQKGAMHYRGQLQRVRAWRRDAAEGEGTVAAPRAFVKAADRAIAAMDGASGAPVPRVPVHGDLGLRNLMIRADGTVLGIDFAGASPQPAAADLSRLLTTYASFFPDPREVTRAAAAADLREAIRATEEGYGKVMAPGLRPLMWFDLLKLWQAVPAQAGRRDDFQARRLAGARRLAAVLDQD
ncbi:aminoglycoside phosphotransferase family protein [Jannaschia sp. S6380]|uniref:phosphotransferase n=1 Tax=Jannaschia sp. S6380 TaxID=2926408 RepID=UPI001FF2DC18|nr:phosphotransferase [Jannaschia sp. S6380]MCK0168062.1 aminoglycoside phosphotransferase family protein [Jannaschia sp. S6380]